MTPEDKGPFPEVKQEDKEKQPFFYFDIAEESSQELEDSLVKDDQEDPLKKLGKTMMYEW